MFNNIVDKYAQYPQQDLSRLKTCWKCEKIRKRVNFQYCSFFLSLKYKQIQHKFAYIIFMVRKITTVNSNK